MKVKELKELAIKREVYPELGSGKNGNIIKIDLINKLEDSYKSSTKSSRKPDIELTGENLVKFADLGDYNKVRYLLTHKQSLLEDLESENESSYSQYDLDLALKISSEKGYNRIVKLLLENGADVNFEYGYPLIHASENGHLSVVKILLEYGANVNAYNGMSLAFARENGHTRVVKLLEKWS